MSRPVGVSPHFQKQSPLAIAMGDMNTYLENMSKSSSASNKAFLLAFAMIVSVPSAALAWDSDSNPDSVLTVSVDMGSNDAGDNSSSESGCTGFASMELSASVLQSRPERVQPAIANPTLQQRLAAIASYPWAVPSIDGAFNDVRYFTRSANVTGSWTVNSDWVESVVDGVRNNQNSPDQKAVLEELLQVDLTNYDGSALTISPETPSLAMVDRRTYVTSPFTLSYDASSCVSDSMAEAGVSIQRTDLEVRANGGWNSVELDWDGSPYNATNLLQIAADGGYRGEAYLLRSRTLSDGDRRINNVASQPGEYDCCGPVFEGDSGVSTMRAVTRLYGDLSQNAQFRTQYGFWMEVWPYGQD